MKNKLIVVSDRRQWSFANLPQWSPIVQQYFEFEPYQANKHYSADAVFLVLAACYTPELAQEFVNRRVIVDICVEGLFGKWASLHSILAPQHCIMYGSHLAEPLPNTVNVANFFWYNEALYNISQGYHTSYVPRKNFSKKFLMPIGNKRAWRDSVVERLEPYLDDAYWSYVRTGRVLPGEPPPVKRYNTRLLNPMWYDDTCFGLVVESYNGHRFTADVPVMVTEKTFKPVAGHQPFMIIGGAGILNYLKSQGFETFDNLFDESYDTETDFDKKLDIIVNNIQNYTKAPYSTKTAKRIGDNFRLFYNTDVIHRGIVKDIVTPIRTYIQQGQVR
jgi:hypothetical protein